MTSGDHNIIDSFYHIPIKLAGFLPCMHVKGGKVISSVSLSSVVCLSVSTKIARSEDLSILVVGRCVHSVFGEKLSSFCFLTLSATNYAIMLTTSIDYDADLTACSSSM